MLNLGFKIFFSGLFKRLVSQKRFQNYRIVNFNCSIKGGTYDNIFFATVVLISVRSQIQNTICYIHQYK